MQVTGAANEVPSSCRFCNAPVTESFCNLGMQPPSNAFLAVDDLNKAERYYPLHAFVCSRCFLVQIDEFESPAEIFSDYAYYSSYSSTWLARSESYVNTMIHHLSLDEKSFVVEVGSNDGYLLKYFLRKGIGVLGIDPAKNCAEAAQAEGVATLVDFFGSATAAKVLEEYPKANLVVANNVLAHVPRLNDFVAGIQGILAPNGLATIEVPHLLRLIERVEYDTIYHEHFSYFSVSTARKLFEAHGLTLVDVEELGTHGGSVRLYVVHAGADRRSEENVGRMLRLEEIAGLNSIETYRQFSSAVIKAKLAVWDFLSDVVGSGKTIAGYGAAAKGNTLLNYCGIGSELIEFVVDRNPYKQGRYLPGSHIPVYPVEHLYEARPDYVMVLPWNIADEIINELQEVREWGCHFVLPIPTPRVI